MKRKTYGYSTILIFALSAACVSCAITDEFFQTQDNRKAETILATLPDCITAYNPWAATGTKSSGESTLAVSKDDLDFEKMEIREDSLRLYYQIPVKDYGFPQELIIRFLQIEPETFPLSEAGEPKTFLLHSTDKDGFDAYSFIATIVPQPKYMHDDALAGFDYFDISGLNGLIFRSTPDGLPIDVLVILKGLYYTTGKISENIGSDPDSSIIAIIGTGYEPETTNDDDPPARTDIIDKAGITEFDWSEFDEFRDSFNTNPEYGFPPGLDLDIGAGGGSSGGGGGGSGNGTSDDEQEGIGDIEVHIVTIGPGTATGAGIYRTGETATCTATPDAIGGTDVAKFVGWAGDLVSDNPVLTFKVASYLGYNLVAMFMELHPCSNEAAGQADPLLKMEILGTKNNGIAGGRFGDARGRKHNGIDLACPIGTPVYSTMNGIVTGIRSGIGLESYDSYTKRVGYIRIENFNTGNAVYITSGSGDDAITSVYWHLTEVYVHEGQPVMCGELIGTSGLTGNAFDPANPEDYSKAHLHYGVKEGGRWAPDTCFVDPEKYLHAIFDNEGKNTKKCD